MLSRLVTNRVSYFEALNALLKCIFISSASFFTIWETIMACRVMHLRVLKLEILLMLKFPSLISNIIDVYIYTYLHPLGIPVGCHMGGGGGGGECMTHPTCNVYTVSSSTKVYR